jgi:hypothetical protein
MPLVAQQNGQMVFVNVPEPLPLADVCGIGKTQGASHVVDGLCVGSKFFDVTLRVVSIAEEAVLTETLRSFSSVDFLAGVARLARLASEVTGMAPLVPNAPPGTPAILDQEALVRFLAAEELGLMPYEDPAAVAEARSRRTKLQEEAASRDAGVAALVDCLC